MASKATRQDRKSSSPPHTGTNAKQGANQAKRVQGESPLTRMASMMEGSSRERGLVQHKESARQGSSVQRLISLAAEINQCAPARLSGATGPAAWSPSRENSAGQIGGAAPVAQRLGSNVNMVGEDDRFFETRTGKTRLRVNPDADAYLEEHFERDSAAKLTNVSLGEKFSHAMNRVHEGIPYDKSRKIEAFDSHRQPTGNGGSRQERGLGYILHTKSATCWEKAAHFHLVLAELGIPTFLEGGVDKSSGEGHAWLVMPASDEAFGGKQVVIDPTSGEIKNRTTYESRYDINVPAKQVATPKVAESPKAIEKALKEFFDLEGMGGIIKKSVLNIVDLKIERAMNEKRLAKEQADWDKLLLKFNESFK